MIARLTELLGIIAQAEGKRLESPRGIAKIQKRLDWRQALIERLAADLQRAFPGTTGFSAYFLPAIWQPAVAKSGAIRKGIRFQQRAVAEPPAIRQSSIGESGGHAPRGPLAAQDGPTQVCLNRELRLSRTHRIDPIRNDSLRNSV